MNKEKIARLAAKGFISFSALILISVSMMAFADPQSVMDLVGVTLGNTDAASSIRGAYGGVGTVLFISLVYLVWTDFRKGLLLLSLLWGFYALSRTITIFVDGPLGQFGVQWLIIESVLFVLALILWLVNRPGSGSTVGANDFR